MTEKYLVVNIRSFIDKDDPAYIGEDKPQEILNEFFCPLKCYRLKSVGYFMTESHNLG